MKKPTKKNAIIGIITALAILAGAYGLLPEDIVDMILTGLGG